MILGLCCAFVAALCQGWATVLQAIGARRVASSDNLDVRLLGRVLGQWPFVVGLVLDFAAFVLSFVALRYLPLFVVQAIVAANLAVTAVAAWWLLGMVLKRRDWVAIGVLSTGLVLIGLSAHAEPPNRPGSALRWALLAAAIAVLVLGGVLAALKQRSSAIVLGVLAGVAFAILAAATRAIPTLQPNQLVRDPGAYAVLVSAFIGFLLYATALQRGSVTSVIGAIVVLETLVPALIGILVLDDRPSPGWAWAAGLGFVLSVAGALVLGRYGEIEDQARPRSRVSSTSSAC